MRQALLKKCKLDSNTSECRPFCTYSIISSIQFIPTTNPISPTHFILSEFMKNISNFRHRQRNINNAYVYSPDLYEYLYLYLVLYTSTTKNARDFIIFLLQLDYHPIYSVHVFVDVRRSIQLPFSRLLFQVSFKSCRAS